MDDVCLILEGTYPFIRGGVSSWVHGIIKAMPELKFSLLTITPSVKIKNKYRYEIPDNVSSFVETFLQDIVIHEKPTPRKRLAKNFWNLLEAYYNAPVNEKTQYFDRYVQGLALDDSRILSTRDILYSREIWDIITRQYESLCPHVSFIDYFWTWRFIQLPILQMLNIEIPPARVYHTVCTGYAGLVGVVAKLKYNKGLILTEHGIYTKERQIDISRADWIYSEKEKHIRARKTPGIFKQMWIDNFVSLGKLCYDYSDEIVTIYGGNKKLEVQFGAQEDSVTVVPNGVDIAGFSNLPVDESRKDGNFKVGLVGRVVPIKDIKTFIKSCKIVLETMTNVEFYIMGPTEEDEQYYDECLELTKMLNVQDKVKFTGKINVKEYYPLLDIMALTSISEGQPLTILEAMCVGCAIVSSDVGACSELIHGYTEEDRALGSCGIVTGIGKPRETGQAIIRILQNPELKARMIKAGLERVRRFYREDMVIDYYRNLYNKYIQRG